MYFIISLLHELLSYFDHIIFRVVKETKFLSLPKCGNEFFPIPESSAIVISVGMELVEPRTFQEAWNHPGLKQCMKWSEAIRKEFSDINKQQFGCKIKQDR